MKYVERTRIRDLEPGDVIRWRGKWRRVVACWPVDFEMCNVPPFTIRLRLECDGRVRTFDAPGSKRVRRREYAPASAAACGRP